ncbi:MAG: RNA polymerase sigma factor (sigma-70 family) [Bacteroidia bacterium]|jgi:RNA polymerase sigma factor (sigma-70 family)
MATDKRDTEWKLVEQCLQGDHSAFEKLYKMLSPKMYAVSLRYTQQDQDAQDVLQEAFIRIYKNLAQFKFSGSFEGWCRRIVSNTAIEALRKKGRIKENSTEVLPELPVDPKSFEKLKYEDLMKLVRALPDGYRSVFNLYVIDGFSHKEIGKMLGVSESTSKTQLYKARLALQKKLSQNLG